MKKFANPDQLSFLDLLRELRPKNTEFSSFNIDLLLRETIVQSIRESPHSRFQIAAKMSELLGVEVTKTMIDSWTAESREGINRFPACYLPAFCHAVGSIEPLKILADLVGSFVIQGEEALMVEQSKIALQKEKLIEKERAIRILLQGIKK
jgi:hypothetical protein